jgi:hypothetical protein
VITQEETLISHRLKKRYYKSDTSMKEEKTRVKIMGLHEGL